MAGEALRLLNSGLDRDHQQQRGFLAYVFQRPTLVEACITLAFTPFELD